MSASAATVEGSGHRSPFSAVVRNAGWLYGAEILVRLMLAALIVVVARILGPAETGKYVFVVSISTIAASGSDFGTTQYFVRTAVHTDASTRSSLFWSVLVFRLAVTACLAAAMVGYALWTPDLETRGLLLLGAVALPISAAPGVVTASLRAQQRMGFEAGGKVIVASVTLLAGGALVIAGRGVTSLGVAGIFAALVGVAYNAAIARRQVELSTPMRVTAPRIRRLVAGAWPYFSTSVLVVAYSRLDTVLLQQLMGPSAVGEYGVAIRVMEVLFVIPGVLGAAVFPAIVQSLPGRPADVVRQSMRGMRVLIAVAMAIALIGMATSQTLFPLMFGSAFGASITVFRILVWTAVPVFASIITSSIIAASHKPIVNTYLAAAMVAVCAAGNLILIPRYGIDGAAVVRLITETVGLVGGIAFIALAFRGHEATS
jgi:O-antigen/teichoic acid export membrane protein